MVKVIGKDEKAVRRVTCRQCASILEFTNSEVEHETLVCMGESEASYFVTCPTCGVHVAMKAR